MKIALAFSFLSTAWPLESSYPRPTCIHIYIHTYIQVVVLGVQHPVALSVAHVWMRRGSFVVAIAHLRLLLRVGGAPSEMKLHCSFLVIKGGGGLLA